MGVQECGSGWECGLRRVAGSRLRVAAAVGAAGLRLPLQRLEQGRQGEHCLHAAASCGHSTIPPPPPACSLALLLHPVDPVLLPLPSLLLSLPPQLADFLKAPVERASGMMPLPDVYCLYNRARGTELISPDDLLTAIKLFPRVSLPAC